MRLFELIEARKNPEQNPKTSINKIIYDKLQTLKKNKEFADEGGTLNGFVSMTSVDKLGINPNSTYNTPLGIYTYPIEFVRIIVGSTKSLETLPFVGEQPFVNIFKARGNIINLTSITETEVAELYKKIGEVYSKSRPKESWKSNVDFIEDIINNAQKHAKFKHVPGGQFWYVTMMVAQYMTYDGGKAPVIWNKLFRDIGIDGCIDYNPIAEKGIGIIHTAEPSQAVFFSTAAVTNNERHMNKYSPNDIKYSKSAGEDEKQEKINLNNQSESQKLITAYNFPDKFRYIKNPSINVQLTAVASEPSNIKYIKQPSDDVVIKAILQSASIIEFMKKYVRNPSDGVLLKLIAKVHDINLFMKEIVKKPSEQVKDAALDWGWQPNLKY
jgi:hypothetical protein